MLKIQPIKNKNLITKNLNKVTNKKILNNKNQSLLTASLLALSVLGLSTINCCSKINTEKEEMEQTDSLSIKTIDEEKFLDIEIDDSLNVIEHIITI